MKYPKYVQVSPDAPDAWWDPKSCMWFKKEDGNIELKDGLDAANIVRYLRFNYLIDTTLLVNPVVVEAEKVQKFVEQTPKQLLKVDEPKVEEVTEEAVAEEDKEEAEEVKDNKEACPYCNKEYAPKGLPNHMKSCKKNPDNQ